MLKSNLTKKEIYSKINEFLKEKIEESQVNVLLVHERLLKRVKLQTVSIEKHALEDNDSVEYYKLTYRFYQIFDGEDGTEEMVSTFNSFLSGRSKGIRDLTYNGSEIEDFEGDIMGTTDEDAEYDEDEKILLEIFKEIQLMNFIKENNFDMMLACVEEGYYAISIEIQIQLDEKEVQVKFDINTHALSLEEAESIVIQKYALYEGKIYNEDLIGQFLSKYYNYNPENVNHRINSATILGVKKIS